MIDSRRTCNDVPRAGMAPPAGGASNPVWHATVVAGASGRLSGAVAESLAPLGTVQEAWDEDVDELVRAAPQAARGSGPSAAELLLAVLGELHSIAAPLLPDFHRNHLPMGLLLEIRWAGGSRAA